MKMSNQISKIASLLKSSQKILIISHTSPDADAYGSSCGLALALRSLGKFVVCINESGVSERLNFIPGVALTLKELPAETFDLTCVVDCGELKRVGDTFIDYVSKLHPLINIDHHISNDLFGDFNYVITDASSTSELIYNLVQEMAVPLTSDAASALYTGILGDTGSFRYSNTTERVFATAQALVKAGAQPGVLSQALFSRNTRASVQVQAAALSSMEFYCEGRCAWIVVPKELSELYKAEREDTEGLVERGRDIDGVIVSVFIREEDQLWKVSMRSKESRYNVSQIASSFGGGGHVMAAAFRWNQDYKELASALKAKIEQLFN
jgi:bifunctional oligoribonuclease and PAP phosphatase NrnA